MRTPGIVTGIMASGVILALISIVTACTFEPISLPPEVSTPEADIVSSPSLHQATVAPPSQPIDTPSKDVAPGSTPQSDLFYSLPTYEVGEIAEIGGFKIQLMEAVLEGERLSITVALENKSPYAIDLGWAIQLRDGDGNFVRAIKSPVAQQRRLETTGALASDWQYDLGKLNASSIDSLRDYRLIYAPRGWSGPVMVFRLTP
jgi:hypothetical protein